MEAEVKKNKIKESENEGLRNSIEMQKEANIILNKNLAEFEKSEQIAKANVCEKNKEIYRYVRM